jgi:hypothetical protein
VESGVKHHNPNPKEISTNQFNILPFSGTNKYLYNIKHPQILITRIRDLESV